MCSVLLAPIGFSPIQLPHGCPRTQSHAQVAEYAKIPPNAHLKTQLPSDICKSNIHIFCRACLSPYKDVASFTTFSESSSAPFRHSHKDIPVNFRLHKRLLCVPVFQRRMTLPLRYCNHTGGPGNRSGREHMKIVDSLPLLEALDYQVRLSPDDLPSLVCFPR